ncbi:hypothetical protein ACWD1Z_20125 [Streptomyces sp. NPDC002784]
MDTTSPSPAPASSSGSDLSLLADFDGNFSPDSLAPGKKIGSPTVGESLDQEEATAAAGIRPNPLQFRHAIGHVDHGDTQPVRARPFGDHPNTVVMPVVDGVTDFGSSG